MNRPKFVDDAITVDEIGIETGRYGRFHLKCAYQPVFRRHGHLLAAFAVEGLMMAFVEGNQVPPHRLFEHAPCEDRMFVDSMCRALHLRNYHNIGVNGLELLLNFDPGMHSDVGVAIGQIRVMAKHLVEIGLDSRLLVCGITKSAALDANALVRLAAEMRRHGIRLAIDDFGSAQSNLDRVDLVGPDVVKIDGKWFRKLTQVAETVRLFPALVAGLKERGADVLVEGIENAWQLRIALDSGVDFYQGCLLGRPALAGTIFKDTPLPIEELTRVPDNVVFLRR
jgi:EAL domain-containing protein (putative c-di-GMP-specific phosphodiesterase class I)